MKRTVLLLASTALAVLLACGVALASPGDLDPSFSGDGKVLTDFAPADDPRDDGASDVIVQPDGKLLAAGSAQTLTDREFALAKYQYDGSLDTSFGSNGKVTTDVAINWNDDITALGLQSYGKIIAAGESYNPSSNTHTFVMARYAVNGTLDTSFGTNGSAKMDFGCCSASLNDALVQADDKIVVGGRGNNGEFLLVRYDKDGSLDTTFGSNGLVHTDINPGVDDRQTNVSSLSLQSDGKIVALGPTNPGSYVDFALARYNAEDGSLDNEFDGDGKLVS